MPVLMERSSRERVSLVRPRLERGAAVLDPSQYTEKYAAVLTQYGADLVGVFDTHAHAGHVSGPSSVGLSGV
jgi:glyoxylase-like metal-dependent hydrolase (beta-lactamase superfamily II)